ncbi:hypothetical protein TrCOL_g3640 [Triparma columacea]|uniref:Fluoride ion transporter CrcB n=1 Tax=Triparma columacea TaxID=722753 RepID=A0A9W7LEB9_9STRA|nr:hypothetical protein TrCOL_g3640 [Triparma columacea]
MSPLDFAILGGGASLGAYTRHIITQKAILAPKTLATQNANLVVHNSHLAACLSPPFHIALINIMGSFILGSLYGYKDGIMSLKPPNAALPNSVLKSSPCRLPPLPPRALLFLGVGYCGALTTFSTFSTDTLALIQASNYARAAAYVALNNVGGIGAAGLGFFLFKRAVPVLARI